MSGSVNKVILIGNLGKDPEIRVLENGTKMARFSVATSERYTDKTTGERKTITDWHDIVLWRGLADVAEKFLKKGRKVYIEGRLKTRSWQDESGVTKYITEVVGDNLTMLTSRAEAEQEINQGIERGPYNTDNAPKKPEPLDDDLLGDDLDDILPF